jgi:hypothetical protein
VRGANPCHDPLPPGARSFYALAMTTRESLHRLVDQLSEDEVEALAKLTTEGRFGRTTTSLAAAPRAFIDCREFPSLAAVWENDDDAIFDEM